MARKAKDTIIKQMNEHGFSKNTADIIIDWCKGTKGAGTPWEEFVDKDRLTATAYESWTSDDADMYLNDKWAKATTRVVPKEWDGSDPLALRDAAVELCQRHYIIDPDSSIYEIVDNETKVVEPIPPEGMVTRVGYTLSRELEAEARRPSEPALVNIILGYFKCNAPRSEKPVLLGQKGEDNFCFQRAVYDLDPTMPIPHWRMFLDRAWDDEAIGAYIAACYFGDYVGRQTLWVSERQGQSGKSSAARVIGNRLFGDRICTAMNAKMLENIHISSHFVNKKLVIAGDNNNPKLLLTGAFKEISGSDKVLVNPKYLTPYSAYLGCRVMVLSNTEPHILGATHSQSRLLWVPVDEMPREQLDPEWERKAEAELPGLLAWALDCYKRRCPDNYEIQVNDRVKQAVAQKVRESEEEFAIPFHLHFVYTGNPADRVTGEDFYRAMAESRLSRNDIKNVKDWMDVTYDVSRTPTKTGYVYKGIRHKTAHDRRTENGAASANDWQMEDEDITAGNKSDAKSDTNNKDWTQYDA